MATSKVYELSRNWRWKERDTSIDLLSELTSNDWATCATFPSEVHVELQAAGQIPDYRKGWAEHDVQCALTLSLRILGAQD
jgi:hypothetical protein